MSPEGHDTRRKILAADDEEISQMLEEAWCLFSIVRPELAFRCGPLAEWLNEEPRSAIKTAAAAETARAAVKAGLMELTRDRSEAQEVDVLAHCNLLLRNAEAPGTRCQHYSPAPVAEALASIALEVPEQEQSICDSFAGTGGMLRAAASELRKAGKNPHDFGGTAATLIRLSSRPSPSMFTYGTLGRASCSAAPTASKSRIGRSEPLRNREAVEMQEAIATGAVLFAAAQSAERGKA